MTSTAFARTNWLEFGIDQVIFSRILVKVCLGLSNSALIYSAIPAILVSGPFAHANINFPKGNFPWWGRIFNSPNVHGVHHTVGLDKYNYGETLIIWDWIFGTFKQPPSALDNFGLEDKKFSQMSITDQQLFPFLKR